MKSVCLCITLVSAVIISGCSTRVPLRLGLAGNAPALTVEQKQPRSHTQILLRFPIGFTEQATAQLQGLYDSGPNSNYVAGSGPELFAERVVRNFYLTLEFQMALEKRLGKGNVVLWPYLLDVSPSGILIEKDDLSPPPHVLRVQLAAKVAGLRLFRNTIAYGDCFGRLVNAECIAVLPDAQMHEVSAQVLGMYTGTPGKNKEYPATIGFFESFGRIDGASELPPLRKRPLNVKRPAKLDSLNFFTPGWKNYEATADAIKAQANQPPAVGESAFSILWDLYANSLIDLLNQIESEKAAAPTVQTYAKDGLRLAHIPSDRQLFNELVDAELDFLAQQDAAFVKLMYQGEFGQSFRKRLVAEMQVEKQQMKAQNLAAFQNLAASAALLGAVASAPGGGAPSLDVSTRSFHTFASTEQRQKQLQFETFSPLKRNFSEISEGQKAFVHKMGGGEKEIRANTLSELRDVARSLAATPP